MFTNGQLVQAADLNNFSVTTVTTSGVITSGGDLVPLGLIDASGASAGQIEFPATQNASSNANTLDDYEEFDWTPTLAFTTVGDLNVVYSTRVGAGIKIGQFVMLECNIVTSTFTHTTASGALIVTGFPNAAKNTTGLVPTGACRWSGITKANFTQVSAVITENTAVASFQISGSGQSLTTIATGDMPTGGTVNIHFTISYRATA